MAIFDQNHVTIDILILIWITSGSSHTKDVGLSIKKSSWQCGLSETPEVLAIFATTAVNLVLLLTDKFIPPCYDMGIPTDKYKINCLVDTWARHQKYFLLFSF